MIFVMLNAAAVVGPLFHFIAAFLLMPPYTGYFICHVVQSSVLECPNAFELSWASLPIRLISGLFASIPAASSIHRTITVAIVDILFGTLAVQQFLGLLRTRITGKRQILGTLNKLKSVQLLVQSYNNMYATMYYSNTIALAVTSVIALAVGAINLRREVPMIGIICLATLSFVGIVYICVGLAAAGRVRIRYESLIENVKADKAFSQSRLLRKVVKSSAPLKIKIGSVNFVDRATAGVFFMFYMEQIGSFALIK
jgi:uncharacterized membrane protein YuzA (DUF378 family)